MIKIMIMTIIIMHILIHIIMVYKLLGSYRRERL